jgi:hypothetical protein
MKTSNVTETVLLYPFSALWPDTEHGTEYYRDRVLQMSAVSMPLSTAMY